MLDIKDLKSLFANEKDSLLHDYFTFLRFHSIATDPHFRCEIEKCANWLTEALKSAGLKVEHWKTSNSPVLFATDLRAGPTKETLLIYCHYDVQPVDPIDEWTSPPFEPTLKKGQIYARGACDNKGQCFYTLAAIKTLIKLLPILPVNLKFLIEGEEESGSSGLSKLLSEKKEELKADHLLIVDSGLNTLETPAITLGARGIVCMQMSVHEAQFDLHSGMTGGIAYNPNRALVELLASLHDQTNRVTIPGFYDDLTELSSEGKKEINFEFDHARFHSQFGFEPTGLETGFGPHESSWLRPTLEINGISGGYAGPGFKTVIPAKATAKISCRLVPNQSPEKIASLVKDFLIKKTPKGLKTTVEILPGNGAGFRTNPKAKIVKLMEESYTQVFQKPCQKILIGGSIPIAAELAKVSGAEMVLVGLGLPDDRIHAPNEHFGLDRLEIGFLTICRAIELFAN